MTSSAFPQNRITGAVLSTQWTFSICYFYFVFVAYLCDGLVSFFVRGVFPPWRQLLAIGLYFILLRFPKKYLGKSGNSFLFLVLACLFWFFLRANLTYATSGIGLTRILYSFWLLTFAIPFFVLPTMYALKQKKPMSLYWKIVCLGGFFGAGLLLDGITGGFFNFLKGGVLSYGVNIEDLIRYSFFAQLLTSVGVFGGLTCALSLYIVSREKNIFKQMFALGMGLLFIAGSWFTGSRQIFFLVLGVYLFGLPVYVFFAKGRKLLLVPCLFFLVPMIAISGKDFLVGNSQDEITERFTAENISEDSRTETWKQGCQEVLGNPKVLLWGNHFAYTGGGGGSDMGESGAHYENTFLCQINNTGIIQGFYVLLPVLFILKKMYDAKHRRTFFDFTTLLFLGGYLLTSLVSPNGVGITALPCLYFIAGVYNVRNYFAPPSDPTPLRSPRLQF